MMVNVLVTAFLSLTTTAAQYLGAYYGRYGYPCPLPLSRIATGYMTGLGYGTPTYGLSVDPYNSANSLAMAGMVVDPALSGMCVDTNMQCPIWASTGQCSTNALIMRRMCALSCGTCVPGAEYGGMVQGMGLGYGGYEIAPLSSPLFGRSIYETGILRSPMRTTIYPKSDKRNKLVPADVYMLGKS
ncbi:unnamed protein product [Cylicocyclus nassatus]|uniref:ShKT domain-containing protein n=1 Tax=Cylicocyclus nassatus TaxID=53992 RepID=A0AA36MBP8_CYLNA|nr:unnamed protein product [Cylicocyclus nassatus]